MIELIELQTLNIHCFILFIINYFTKCVEASSHANVTRQVVAQFIKKEIKCLYGFPNNIITNNFGNLNNKMMKELCRDFKIENHSSSPYRPKMNSVVEVANVT